MKSSYGTCIKCGCTDYNACHIDIHDSCSWMDETHELCSFCLESMASDNTIERPFDFDDKRHHDYDIINLQNPRAIELHDLADSFNVDPELKSKQEKIDAILDKQAKL